MDVAPYMARFRHAPGTHVRVFVNDVPIYDRAVMFFGAPSFPATPWFIPGENRVDIEVYETPPHPDMPTVPRHFEVLFFEQGADIEKDEKTLYEEKFPNLLEKLPPEERQLPCRWTDKFTPEGEIPPPIWEKATPERIPDEGTPELLKAVHELHHAFVTRDVDALVAAAMLKLEDQRRYFGATPKLSAAEVKKEHEQMLAQPWDVAPFDPNNLLFRPCAGGRVAYATNKNGGPALMAQHKHADQRWQVKPLLIRQNAEWRVYR